MSVQAVMLGEYGAPRIAYRYWRIKFTDWTDAYAHDGGGGVRCASMRLVVAGVEYPTVAMTSNTAPSPLVASASSEYTSGFQAWNAFDAVIADSSRWISTLATSSFHWLQIDFGAGNQIAPDKLRYAPDDAVSAGYYPYAFTLYASNSGAFAGEEVAKLSVVNSPFTNLTYTDFTIP